MKWMRTAGVRPYLLYPNISKRNEGFVGKRAKKKLDQKTADYIPPLSKVFRLCHRFGEQPPLNNSIGRQKINRGARPFRKRTLGNVIFVDARFWSNNFPVDSSKMNTENARCKIPRGCSIMNSWDVLFEAEPITLSSSSKTRTVSFSIISVWVMALPSHAVVVDGPMALLFVLTYSTIVS